MIKSFVSNVFLVIVIILATSCGQRGPLYLPDSTPPSADSRIGGITKPVAST